MPRNVGLVTGARTTRLRDWVADQRPRERLLRLGADALTDAELLALLIGSGTDGRNVVEVAGDVLRAADGVAGLLATSATDMTKFAGVGPAAACRIRAAAELGRRGGRDSRAQPVSNRAEIAAVVLPGLQNRAEERFVVVILDRRLRLKDVVTVAVGGVGHASVPVAEVLQTVLRAGGAAFAVAHNHPGGTATPSDADRATTTALRNAAQACGLRFLDHLVVADAQWVAIE